MKHHNYTIIRCQTDNKNKVMDLLCDAEVYKLVNNHVDVVYYNGDTLKEKRETMNIIQNNITKLLTNNIPADSKPEYLSQWHFIPIP